MHRFLSAFAAIGFCVVLAGCDEPVAPDDQQLGLDAFNRNQYAAAMEVFRAEERQDPKNPYVELNIARTYAATGDRDNAILYYKKVLVDGQDIYPGDVPGARRRDEGLAGVACDRLVAMGVACE
jgi:tetratricopeptide (TPR) repeat protein